MDGYRQLSQADAVGNIGEVDDPSGGAAAIEDKDRGGQKGAKSHRQECPVQGLCGDAPGLFPDDGDVFFYLLGFECGSGDVRGAAHFGDGHVPSAGLPLVLPLVESLCRGLGLHGGEDVPEGIEVWLGGF